MCLLKFAQQDLEESCFQSFRGIKIPEGLRGIARIFPVFRILRHCLFRELRFFSRHAHILILSPLQDISLSGDSCPRCASSEIDVTISILRECAEWECTRPWRNSGLQRNGMWQPSLWLLPRFSGNFSFLHFLMQLGGCSLTCDLYFGCFNVTFRCGNGNCNILCRGSFVFYHLLTSPWVLQVPSLVRVSLLKMLA